jgi:hypothetical protein
MLGLAVCGCDPVQEPQVAGGGPVVRLDEAAFVERVSPVLDDRGCANAACHGGQGSGELLLSGGVDLEADFNAVAAFTTPWAVATSPLLQKPLAEAAGGVVHGGGDIFADTLDADYRTLHDWIAGN